MMTNKQISDIQSGIWLIGIAILLITGDWWPGILILVGVSMVVSSVLRRQENSERLQPPAKPEATESQGIFGVEENLPDPSPKVSQAPTPTPSASAAPMEPAPARPVDRLPETCSACGAPVRGMDVQWTGFDQANCGFCGSTLKMK